MVRPSSPSLERLLPGGIWVPGRAWSRKFGRRAVSSDFWAVALLPKKGKSTDRCPPPAIRQSRGRARIRSVALWLSSWESRMDCPECERLSEEEQDATLQFVAADTALTAAFDKAELEQWKTLDAEASAAHARLRQAKRRSWEHRATHSD